MAVAAAVSGGLILVPDDSVFWPLALGTQLLGLSLCLAGAWHLSRFYLLLGTALVAAGSVTALTARRFYADMSHEIGAQLLQAWAQALGLISMAVGLGAWMGQVAGPVLVKACRRLRRWYKRTCQKPRVLHVADLAAEAPGSCSVCLGELADDDNEGVLRLSCRHAFHRRCIGGWMELKDRAPTCPSCRRTIGDLRRCTHLRRKKEIGPRVVKIGGAGSAAADMAPTVVTVLHGGGAGTGGASAGGAPAAPVMTVLVPPSASARGAGSDDASPRTAAAARLRPATAPEPCGRLPSPVELRRHVPRRLAQPTRPRPQPALPREAWEP